MFIGEFTHTVDHKGRIALPAKFRARLAEGCVVTRGLDECLFVYSKSEWEKIAQKIATLPISQADARAFSRLMLAGAMDLQIDKQGRIILPGYLREYAQIKNNVLILGLYNRLEIWDKENWEEYKTRTEEKSNDIAEHLGELGV